MADTPNSHFCATFEPVVMWANIYLGRYKDADAGKYRTSRCRHKPGSVWETAAAGTFLRGCGTNENKNFVRGKTIRGCWVGGVARSTAPYCVADLHCRTASVSASYLSSVYQ